MDKKALFSIFYVALVSGICGFAATYIPQSLAASAPVDAGSPDTGINPATGATATKLVLKKPDGTWSFGLADSSGSLACTSSSGPGGVTVVAGIDHATAASATNPLPGHETGYAIHKNGCQCVLCATDGSGTQITLTTGVRYIEKVVDFNGSPVQVAEAAACTSFGGTGEMKMAGSTMDLTPVVAPSGTGPGLSTYQTCCAQFATASPQSGPWYCVCLAQ